MTRYISWNVNGLRAAEKKGFSDSVLPLNADCICIQETKLQGGQIDLKLPGYESYWSYAEKKGYSGTAIFTARRFSHGASRFPYGTISAFPSTTPKDARLRWSSTIIFSSVFIRRMHRTACAVSTIAWPGRMPFATIC